MPSFGAAFFRGSFSIGVNLKNSSIYLSNIPTDVFPTPNQLTMVIKLLISILDENIERQERLLAQKVLSVRRFFDFPV
jgi:hypothetical protein